MDPGADTSYLVRALVEHCSPIAIKRIPTRFFSHWRLGLLILRSGVIASYAEISNLFDHPNTLVPVAIAHPLQQDMEQEDGLSV